MKLRCKKFHVKLEHISREGRLDKADKFSKALGIWRIFSFFLAVATEILERFFCQFLGCKPISVLYFIIDILIPRQFILYSFTVVYLNTSWIISFHSCWLGDELLRPYLPALLQSALLA